MTRWSFVMTYFWTERSESSVAPFFLPTPAATFWTSLSSPDPTAQSGITTLSTSDDDDDERSFSPTRSACALANAAKMIEIDIPCCFGLLPFLLADQMSGRAGGGTAGRRAGAQAACREGVVRVS